MFFDHLTLRCNCHKFFLSALFFIQSTPGLLTKAIHKLPHRPMRALSISAVAAAVQFAIFALASPVIDDRSLSLSARAKAECANFPGVIAGTYVKLPSPKYFITDPHRRFSYVSPTAQNIANPSWNIGDMLRHVVVPRRGEVQRWCAPKSETYVVIRVTNAVVSETMTSTLAQVYQAVCRQISLRGDGLIGVSGYWAKTNACLTVRISNANDHQITWGVFGSALLALGDYMVKSGSGGVAFLIYDGENEVGQGSII